MSGLHTPGPWLAEPSRYIEATYIVQAQGPSRRVLASFDGDGDGYDPTDIANANLIAAAPELLESLRATLALSRIKYGNLDADVNVTLDAAAAALLKATGEPS